MSNMLTNITTTWSGTTKEVTNPFWTLEGYIECRDPFQRAWTAYHSLQHIAWVVSQRSGITTPPTLDKYDWTF